MPEPDGPIPDSLAHDLPGLPITLGDLTIDESGFHREARGRRPARHAAWSDLTAVRPGLFALVVEGRRGPGAAVRDLFRVWARTRNVRRGVEVWKEYRLRVLERGGVLHGSAATAFMRRVAWFFLLGSLAMVFCAGSMLWLAPRFVDDAAADPVLRSMAEDWHLGVAWFALMTWAALGVVVAVTAYVSAFAISWWRTMRRWSRWEFSRDGLAFRARGERRLVAPSEQIGSGLLPGVRIGKQRAMLCEGFLFVAAPVVWPLFLALNERAGRRMRLGLVAFAVLFAVCAALTWPVAWYAWRDLLLSEQAHVSPFLAVWGALLAVGCTVAIVALPWWVRRTHARLLAEGRAPLERLGW